MNDLIEFYRTKTTDRCILVDETGLTSHEAVWAGGDAVTGAATVIQAMGAGKLAAVSIDQVLSR